jgi:hypothetical protein
LTVTVKVSPATLPGSDTLTPGIGVATPVVIVTEAGASMLSTRFVMASPTVRTDRFLRRGYR